MRGGSEAYFSNKILANLFRQSLKKNKINKYIVQFVENQNRIKDAKIELETIPKLKKVNRKKFPFDLSLGYYTNDIKLELDGPSITSTNRMISLQVGKIISFNQSIIL